MSIYSYYLFSMCLLRKTILFFLFFIVILAIIYRKDFVLVSWIPEGKNYINDKLKEKNLFSYMTLKNNFPIFFMIFFL